MQLTKSGKSHEKTDTDIAYLDHANNCRGSVETFCLLRLHRRHVVCRTSYRQLVVLVMCAEVWVEKVKTLIGELVFVPGSGYFFESESETVKITFINGRQEEETPLNTKIALSVNFQNTVPNLPEWYTHVNT